MDGEQAIKGIKGRGKGGVTIIKIKKKRWIILIVCIGIAFILWIAWGNKALELNTYIIVGNSLPEEFAGYRIAQVSDLHNAEMGAGNKKLLTILQNARPNIIVITGDFIDSYRTDTEIALGFMEEAVKIAPCYYVTGNHEARVWEVYHKSLEQRMIELGVTILHDEEVILEKEGAGISLIGIDDPMYAVNRGNGVGIRMEPNQIQRLSTVDSYTILLSHRPEFFQQYVEARMDLVLSGHAHGGQFRLPFVGGLIAPNQGLFPKYDAGLYTEGNTHMIVSRGIGNSIFPFRFSNRPEVILVELQAGE